MGVSASGKNTNSNSSILLPAHLLQTKSRDQLQDLAAVMNLQMVNMSESNNFIQNNREELKRENRRFRKILDIIDSGLVIHQGGIILESNRTFNRMFDYRKKELIGRNIDTMIDRSSLKKISNNIIMDTTKTHEGTAVRRDGSTFPCEIKSRVIESRGSIVHLTIFKDITAKKEAEEEKVTLQEKLCQSEKMEAVGHLASCVAHDLNNILGAIVGYPDLIMMEGSLNDSTREMVERIKESGIKAAALVQDLLTMARRGVISTEIVNINTIIGDFFQSPEFDKLKQNHHKVFFKMELDESLMNILGSPFHINKALMNLITNAAEAMPRGGTITVQTTNLEFDRMVKGYGLNDYAVVKIIDEGVGIPEEEVDKIFEPFYTKKDMGKSGTGLGMSVVWGAVRDHKGYINMDSEVGEGTTFELYFPTTHQGTGEAFDDDGDNRELRGRGERILIVDDEEDQRELALSMMSGLGYQARAVGSGEAAIEFLNDHEVDLLVLDMIMDPGIDGLDTFIGARKVRNNIKAVITSGFSQTDRVRKAQEKGCGKYLNKPYSYDEIARTIREELDR